MPGVLYVMNISKPFFNLVKKGSDFKVSLTLGNKKVKTMEFFLICIIIYFVNKKSFMNLSLWKLCQQYITFNIKHKTLLYCNGAPWFKTLLPSFKSRPGKSIRFCSKCLLNDIKIYNLKQTPVFCIKYLSLVAVPRGSAL